MIYEDMFVYIDGISDPIPCHEVYIDNGLVICKVSDKEGKSSRLFPLHLLLEMRTI